jgi:putative addiction module component (TIGR02574 family)
MTQLAAKLLADAIQLPEGDRGDLAAKLIESLDPGSEDDVAAAWSAEIRQRLDELQSGQVQAVSWTEARRMILDDTDDAAAP